MVTVNEERPWDELERLVAEGQIEQIAAYLEEMPAGDVARALSRLEEAEQDRLIELLGPERSANLFEMLPEAQAGDLLERIEPEVAAAILQELPSDEQADVLQELDQEDADEILAELETEDADQARFLASYEDNEAGGLMATEFLAFRDTLTVGEVVDDLRRRADEYEDEEVQYTYVVSESSQLVGVLPLRSLLLTASQKNISSVMIQNPITVRDLDTLDRLAEIFDSYDFLDVPVVDERHAMLGVVHRSSFEEAMGERSDSDHLKSQGIVGGEEFRSMPLRSRSTRRLSWLSVNIVLNVIAASVIAAYQDTLAAVIALAVFLPIISDMSGCSGNQAVAVSMRELSVGLVKPFEIFYVLRKELLVGLVNGTALGLLIAGVAWLWKGSPWLGLVVGLSLALNTLVAVAIGGTVPLILKRFNMDPALASGPILTTITDMCGFFLVLSIATLLLTRLT